MNNIIKYLNDNAGAITSIATTILAIITGLYVLFTYWLAKEAKRQADMVLEQRKSALKREIIEKVYYPLKKEISIVMNLENYRDRNNPPNPVFWDNYKQDTPFLAYLVELDISQKLESLLDKYERFKEKFSTLRNLAYNIVWDVFEKRNREIVFFFKNIYFNHNNYLPLTLILYQAVNSGITTIEELFENSSTITCKFVNGSEEVLELTFTDFKSYWSKIEEKIKQNQEIQETLELFKEIFQESESLIQIIDKDIKDNAKTTFIH